MATKKAPPLFQVGDRVKIRYSDWRGRIIEFRGPLAPGGVFVYRVRIPNKPKPRYIELREDQLIAIPTRPKPKPGPSSNQTPDTPGHQGDGQALPDVTASSLPFFQKGDRVEIRDTNWRGRVTELRIPSTPGQAYIYRVRVPAEPRSIYVELPGNYLVAVPSPVKKRAKPSAKQRVRDEQKGK